MQELTRQVMKIIMRTKFKSLSCGETSTTAAAAKDKSRNPAAKRTIPRFAFKVGEGATRPTARANPASLASQSTSRSTLWATNGGCIEIS